MNASKQASPQASKQGKQASKQGGGRKQYKEYIRNNKRRKRRIRGKTRKAQGRKGFVFIALRLPTSAVRGAMRVGTSQDAVRAYPHRLVSLWRGLSLSLSEDAQRAYMRRLPRSQFTAVAVAALGRAARLARPQARFAEARGRCCRAPRCTLSRGACIADHRSATRG